MFAIPNDKGKIVDLYVTFFLKWVIDELYVGNYAILFIFWMEMEGIFKVMKTSADWHTTFQH
jgi:hypothetical protein